MRLAGAHRDHADLDAGVVREQRQQIAEQAGLLGRGGRLHDDELVGGRRAAPSGSARSAAPGTSVAATAWCSPLVALTQMTIRPARKARAGLRSGRGEEPCRRRSARSPGRDAGTRPRRRGGGPDPDRGSTRTILVPVVVGALRSCSSTASVEAGSRLAVGSSRNRTSGSTARRAPAPAAAARRPRARRAGRARERRRAARARALAAPGRPRRRTAGRARAAHSRCWPATERRSSTGRWNTIACRRRIALVGGRPRQGTVPAVGRSRPCSRRSSRLLPAPFGPMTRSAGRPRASGRCRPPAACRRPRRRARAPRSGRIVRRRLGGAAIRAPAARDSGIGGPGARCWRSASTAALTSTASVIRIRPSASASARLPLRGLERDRRRHHAGDVVDVAADDHDRADLGDGAAEAGERRGHQAVAAVPEQGRRRSPGGADAERAQLLGVLGPPDPRSPGGPGPRRSASPARSGRRSWRSACRAGCSTPSGPALDSSR